MAQSIGILNYLAFFVLYIICFVFIYQKFSELIGFGILLVVNTACFLYATNDVMKIFQSSFSFVQMISILSIVIGLSFHTVIIVFIIMVANNLNVKYTKKYGTPFNLPKKYKEKLELLKRLMISSFCLGTVILYTLFYYNHDLKHNFTLIMTHFDIKYVYEYKTLFFTLAAALSLLGISSYEIAIGDEFSKLSRQKLMDEPKY
jgi:hypothetical protein